MDLDHNDVHYLRSAIGWLELGSPAESLVELDAMSAAGQAHVDTIEARWLALAELKRWEAATQVARQLIAAAPDRSIGWLHHAYALRRSSNGSVLAAYNALSPVAERFPKEAIIPYNLACYTCQLERDPKETLAWLKQAIAAGQRKEIVAMALKDPDLKPLRKEIAKLAGKA
jgi:hypothetical protein